jgi:hypothetical protein
MGSLFRDGEVLEGREAAEAIRTTAAGGHGLLVQDRAGPPPGWIDAQVEATTPAALSAERPVPQVVIVHLGSCTDVVDALDALDARRRRAHFALAFEALPGNAVKPAEVAVPSFHHGDHCVWVPVLHPRAEHALRALLARLRPLATLPVVPWPAAEARRGDELLVASARLLEEAGVRADDLIHASDSTPLDLYATLTGLHATLADLRATATDRNARREPGGRGGRLAVTPHACDAHGLAAALAAHERAAILVPVLAPRPPADPSTTRVLWLSPRV